MFKEQLEDQVQLLLKLISSIQHGLCVSNPLQTALLRVCEMLGALPSV